MNTTRILEMSVRTYGQRWWKDGFLRERAKCAECGEEKDCFVEAGFSQYPWCSKHIGNRIRITDPIRNI